MQRWKSPAWIHLSFAADREQWLVVKHCPALSKGAAYAAGLFDPAAMHAEAGVPANLWVEQRVAASSRVVVPLHPPPAAPKGMLKKQGGVLRETQIL